MRKDRAKPPRRSMNHQDRQSDNLDDLRAQLPAPFDRAAHEHIAQLWVGWNAARRGHRRDYLTRQLGLPADVAEHLVELAQQSRRRSR